MAGKTLIGGTGYGITGGEILKDGVSYSVKNGKVLVNGTEYDISFVKAGIKQPLGSGDNEYNFISCITYADGYWVAGGTYSYNSQYYARIAYAIDPAGTWTILDLWSGSNDRVTLNCITYANGYWVAGGTRSDGYAVIGYSTSVSSGWTVKSIWPANNSDTTIKCVTYANGYWVVGGRYYDGSNYYARIAYATSPSGTWTTKDLWSGSNIHNSINGIVYGGDKWVVAGCRYNGYNYYSRVAYTTDPSGIWTIQDLLSSGYYNSYNCIIYAKGLWAVGGVYYNGSLYSVRVAYAASLSGTWMIKEVWSSSADNCTVHSIAYANGYWVIGGTADTYYARIAYATSPSGAWTTKDMWGYPTNYNGINCITYANRYWVLGGRVAYPSGYYEGRLIYDNFSVPFSGM